MPFNESKSRARHIARAVCDGFRLHDRAKYDASAVCFREVYAALFPELEADATQLAGTSYVRALAIKDAIDADRDRRNRLVDPRWSLVYAEFLEMCRALHLDELWAYHYNEFWKHHKAELDYWSSMLAAERIFVERVTGGSAWYDKRSDGRNGPGPLAFLYGAAVEAHDLHTPQAWALAEDVMCRYYEIVLASRDGVAVSRQAPARLSSPRSVENRPPGS